MKRITQVLLVFMFAQCLGALASPPETGGDPAQNVKAGTTWTVLVYLDADNDLEEFAITDFAEMASVGSSANLNIVVQFDRIDGYDTSNDDWEDCQRFVVTNGMTPTVANAVSDWGDGSGGREVNMGDQATLLDFINWGTTNYPADNTMLILWNHGSGWYRSASLPPVIKSICNDFTSGSSLAMDEVRSALDSATNDVTALGFDACLMGMLEVAYEFRNTGASVMVASEEVIPGDGWPYDTILTDLAADTTIEPDALGQVIVDAYYAEYSDYTLSAVRLSEISTLADRVNVLADAMRSDWNTTTFTNIVTAAQNVSTQMSNVVIAEQHGSSYEGSNGLAIYFPQTSVHANYSSSLLFTADTLWDDFASDFVSLMSNSWIASIRDDTIEYYDPSFVDLKEFCDTLALGDSYEEDDSFTDASTIADGDIQAHTIHVAGDEDFVTFTLTDQEIVFLTTAGSTGDTVLYLYDSSYTQVAQNDNTNSSNLFSTLIELLDAGTYYARVIENGNDGTLAYALSYSVLTSDAVVDVDDESISVDIDEGETAGNETFRVRNNGLGTLGYTITENRSWMDVTPTSGTSTGEWDTITITFDTDEENIGVDVGTITLVNEVDPTDVVTVTVTLTVSPDLFGSNDDDDDDDGCGIATGISGCQGLFSLLPLLSVCLFILRRRR